MFRGLTTLRTHTHVTDIWKSLHCTPILLLVIALLFRTRMTKMIKITDVQDPGPDAVGVSSVITADRRILAPPVVELSDTLLSSRASRRMNVDIRIFSRVFIIIIKCKSN